SHLMIASPPAGCVEPTAFRGNGVASTSFPLEPVPASLSSVHQAIDGPTPRDASKSLAPEGAARTHAPKPAGRAGVSPAFAGRDAPSDLLALGAARRRPCLREAPCHAATLSHLSAPRTSAGLG